MNKFSLPVLMAELHDEIEHRLDAARKAWGHSGTKGDATEHVWIELFQKYLPRRYSCQRAHVVDSTDSFSEQIDIVVFDRQYSPLVFKAEGQKITPAESVYAVFEAKQTISASLIDYAQQKVESVRRLHRTSLPIPHAGGVYAPKSLPIILDGILALESEWKPPLGDSLINALAKNPEGRLDLGCVAAHGFFSCDESGSYTVTPQGNPSQHSYLN